MRKLKTNNGFTLVEIICSISIFSVMLSMIITIELKNISLHNENLKLRDYKYFMEALKNDIEFNWNYEELKQLSAQKMYIEGNNINITELKQGRGRDILTTEKPDYLPYIEIFIQGNDATKINIKFNYKFLASKKESNYEFSKVKQQ
jgi:prepilin-type N-terminal cleavage/methylation domain-containing protein